MPGQTAQRSSVRETGGTPVLDAVSAEQLAQRAVVDVGERVVGLQPLGADAVAGEEDQGTLEKSGDGVGALVAVQLGVDQPRVVIRDRVAELPANPGLLLGAGRRAITGHLVSWATEAREALGVHLQQIARARPLKAPDLLARSPRPP